MHEPFLCGAAVSGNPCETKHHTVSIYQSLPDCATMTFPQKLGTHASFMIETLSAVVPDRWCTASVVHGLAWFARNSCATEGQPVHTEGSLRKERQFEQVDDIPKKLTTFPSAILRHPNILADCSAHAHAICAVRRRATFPTT